MERETPTSDGRWYQESETSDQMNVSLISPKNVANSKAETNVHFGQTFQIPESLEKKYAEKRSIL